MTKSRGDNAILFAAATLAIKQRDATIGRHTLYLGRVLAVLEGLMYNIRCAQIGETMAEREAEQRKIDEEEIKIYRAKYGTL